MDGPLRIATVIPTWQESQHIEACLSSILSQTHPASHHRVIVVDGGSEDGTREKVQKMIERSADGSGPMIELLDNPDRYVPQARNIALSHLGQDCDLIFEMIGHATIPPDHIEQRIADMLDLEAELGKEVAGIGTRVVADPAVDGMQARWIETALTSRLGSSGGQFSRFKGRMMHHIPAFVIHRRSSLEEVGGWDSSFPTNQDSDLSMRLRKAGLELWRSDISHVSMVKRQTLGGLARMCLRYGAWRTRSLVRHPGRLNPLEFLPLFGLALLIGLSAVASPYWCLPLAAYAGVLALTGLVAGAMTRDITMVIGSPASLLIIHTFFTIGLFMGILPGRTGFTDR